VINSGTAASDFNKYLSANMSCPQPVP